MMSYQLLTKNGDCIFDNFRALFKSLAESMLILSLAPLDFAESFHFFVVPGLTHLSELVLLGLYTLLLP